MLGAGRNSQLSVCCTMPMPVKQWTVKSGFGAETGAGTGSSVTAAVAAAGRRTVAAANGSGGDGLIGGTYPA
ncbi:MULTISPECIES: hypothetical protein [unclassified Kitasatospora]|uniref:hypothetical protein n=1 Tax=Kitasatospora sp. NPDC001261 TaxID=3364012 RepID=UPI0036811433